MAVSSRYEHAGVVLVRATTYTAGLDLPLSLDPSDDSAMRSEGRAWLARVWAEGRFREALSIATPALAAQIDTVLSEDAAHLAVRDLRRTVLSVISYVARWQRRTTPFGLFAGVASATPGARADGQIGTDHRVYLRADAEWLGTLVDGLERHPQLRRRLLIAADSGRVVRDGRVIVAGRPRPGEFPGPLLELSVANTRPAQAALGLCAQPIRFDELVSRLVVQFPTVAVEKIEQLLHNLINQQIVTTSLRAPMTAVDAFAHVLDALRAAAAHELPDLKVTVDRLEEIAVSLRSASCTSLTPVGTSTRRSIVAMMRAAAPRHDTHGYPLAVDVRLDAKITVPDAVLREAAAAADVLVRLSTKPFGTSAWINYHQRFRARYGPGALVPVRELVADSGLGYPAGYLGAPQARPTWRTVNERDVTMLAALQRANWERSQEIELTEPLIRALTAGERGTPVPPQRVELAFDLHARNLDDIDRGRFELWIDAVPRSGSSMAGRFAYLLDQADTERLATSFRDEAPNTATMQLSFPPRRLHNENIVRTPELLPDVIRISEFSADGRPGVSVDDLGVTADDEQLYLVHLPTGKRVIPRTLHALEATIHTPLLARFLSEVADARSAVFSPFNFGAARTLPYTPRIRYRRTILAPARWLLKASDLGDDAAVGEWERRLKDWTGEWRVPARVVLCQGELRLPLDLDQVLDRALLRLQLRRTERVELREAGDPNAHDWLGVPSQLLVPLVLKASSSTRQLPAVTTRPSPAQNAGHGDVLHVQLIGNPARFDEILGRHLPAAVAGLGGDRVVRWWVRRFRDLIRLDTDQYVSLFLRLANSDAYGDVARQVANVASGLQARGLISRVAIASYQEQSGRYGEGEALVGAEFVFAADTAAAVAQINVAAQAAIPAQALAAVSMTAMATAFAPDAETGCRLLAQVLKQETGPMDRTLREVAVRLAEPTHRYAEISKLRGGEAVVRAWDARDEALKSYYTALAAQRDPSTVLRTLLHDHHVRALGVDPKFEALTNRLARSCALRRIALSEVGSR